MYQYTQLPQVLTSAYYQLPFWEGYRHPRVLDGYSAYSTDNIPKYLSDRNPVFVNPRIWAISILEILSIQQNVAVNYTV